MLLSLATLNCTDYLPLMICFVWKREPEKLIGTFFQFIEIFWSCETRRFCLMKHSWEVKMKGFIVVITNQCLWLIVNMPKNFVICKHAQEFCVLFQVASYSKLSTDIG